MTDLELTALAARTYGIAPEGFSPLTDDEDALRLAVKLGLEVFTIDAPSTNAAVSISGVDWIISEPRGDDPYAATRRAIVRAAAFLATERAAQGAQEGS